MALQDLLLASFILQISAAQAFWWPSSTTESPMMFKQVPLTYFRTYTFQPLVGNPLAYPFLGNSLFNEQPDNPRYDRLDGNYVNPMMPIITKFNMQSPLQTPTTRKPSTTRPTATTTTTKTTSTTSTTPEPATASTEASAVRGNMPKDGYYAEQPLYNRRAYYNNMPSYQRQPYPYPNYNVYENGNNGMNYVDRQSASPYMPCMCPVGVSGPEHMRSAQFASQSRSPYGGDAISALGANLEVPNDGKTSAFFKQSVNDGNNRETLAVTPMSLLRNT